MADVHGRPTAAELVTAVREFLERDVFGAVDGRVRFHTRVAMNALAMVERELDVGRAQAERHAADLAALGVADEAELAAAIRDRRLDDRMPEVVEAVRRTVKAKLEVANPSYLGTTATQ